MVSSETKGLFQKTGPPEHTQNRTSVPTTQKSSSHRRFKSSVAVDTDFAISVYRQASAAVDLGRFGLPTPADLAQWPHSATSYRHPVSNKAATSLGSDTQLITARSSRKYPRDPEGFDDRLFIPLGVPIGATLGPAAGESLPPK